jgi:flagellar motility protein MotE (MotC chaperone)
MAFSKRTAIALLCASLATSHAWAESNVPRLDGAVPNVSQDYCSSFLSEAEKARESRQKLELEDLNAKVDKKLAEIREKTTVLESWVTRREAMLAEATSAVLKIYDVMDSTVAAQQLSKIDVATVSVILRKMKPKKSSGILKEMDPQMAARIVATLSAEANLQHEEKNEP